MGELSDEVLMAYADDSLEPDEQLRVEAMVAADPDLRRRLEAFTATGSLAQMFNKPMTEPVPRHLVDLVMHGTGESPARASRSAGVTTGMGAWDMLMRVLSLRLPQLPAALAYSAGLMVAGGVGWLLASQSGSDAPLALFVLENGRTVATGGLARVLETAPSGTRMELGGAGAGAFAQVRMTFKSAQGFCRQYELSAPVNGGSVGVACRDEQGRWLSNIQAHVARPQSSKNGIKPAAGPAALAAVVDGLMVGDAFGTAEESISIASGWRR